ncbi:MAG: hypothetical protein RMM28_11190, partial [Thermoleophilia bacterium]|nr:hypothetical protein [Thermoleophilia bacterium]
GSERRRALELVARELEASGDGELAGVAKALAWSSGVPHGPEAALLVARVRAELERERGTCPAEEGGTDAR